MPVHKTNNMVVYEMDRVCGCVVQSFLSIGAIASALTCVVTVLSVVAWPSKTHVRARRFRAQRACCRQARTSPTVSFLAGLL